MDVFIEKIVQKQKDAKDIASIFGIWLLALIVSYFAVVLIPAFGIMVAAGVIYGAWYLATSLNLEFEYILTNGEMDVDKIIARRKRKRLFSVKGKDFEIFAPYTESYKNDYNSQAIKKKFYALSSLASPDAYFAIFEHKEFGKTLLVFEPDDRMISSFKAINPRRVFER